jgi:hypothetical protein
VHTENQQLFKRYFDNVDTIERVKDYVLWWSPGSLVCIADVKAYVMI